METEHVSAAVLNGVPRKLTTFETSDDSKIIFGGEFNMILDLKLNTDGRNPSLNPIWTGLFANLKRLGGDIPLPPHLLPPNLAISTMKLGKDILWVEIFKK